MSKGFTLGFTGATLDEILPWAEEQVVGGGSRTIVVAMAGSGKDIAYLSGPGRTIVSWDPQEISRVVVEGVFKHDPLYANGPGPVERGRARGYATEVRPIRGMPEDCAQLADWIALVGTDLDRAALVTTLVRSTFHGRLTTWARIVDADAMYAKFKRAWYRLSEYVGLLGTFHHYKGSVFEDPRFDQWVEGATLYVDTPKVVNRGPKGDIYSAGFEGLNSIIAQEPQTLPRWTEETFRRDMPKLFRAPWRRMILFHVTGAKPSVEDVQEMLYDTLTGPNGRTVPGLFDPDAEWLHKGRQDVAWVIDR